MTKAMLQCALNSIPKVKPRTHEKRYINDSTLKTKCKASKCAWFRWKDAGKPRAGPLFQSMLSTKKNVKTYVRKCRAKVERARIQSRNQMFRERHPARFHCPRRNVSCQKLAVNGQIVTDKPTLLRCWKDHFESLSKSRTLSECSSTCISSLLAKSYSLRDEVLDTPLSIEEVENDVRKLKNGKGLWSG